MERKVWGKRDDEILKYLREQRGQRKWATIARIMEQQFDIPGRTGKQCRERYHNHLDANIVNGEWTEQEEDMLFELHGEMGNKWSLIALKLPGRADNCVKNHFYSKLRKAARKLNKIIEEYFASQFAELKSSTLSEIIEITESKFKMNSKIDEQLAEFCNGIKNRLFKFRYVDGEPIDEQTLVEAKALIQDIDSFSKDFNRCHKSRADQKKIYRAYLKPPLVKKSNSQNSGSSENNSEDNFSSNLSSASRVSSCSDFSEYDQAEKEKPVSNNSTGPRSQGQISRHYSDRELGRTVKNERVHSHREISIEKDERVRSSRELVGSDKNEVDSPLPGKGERVHFNPIEKQVEKPAMQVQVQNLDQGPFQIQEQPLDSEMKQFYYNNNNMFDEIPLITRILAPMEEERSSLLFRRDGSSDSGDIQFKEERD